MWYRFTLSGFWCLFQASLVFAAIDAAPPFVSDDNPPSVLSATRLQQSLFDVPAAVTVIDRQMIEQSGMREIPELLRLVPGMVVGYESGSEAFVSFHGTSADLARRMQVLVDGRSIYQPLLASVDWIGLPLELADIERIEVIRGPNSSAFGANSFLAVVNIITRHPADVDRARLSYTRGEDGVEDFLARIAQRTGPVDWRFSLSGRSDDGFEKNLDPKKSHLPFTDSKDVDSLYGRGVWTVNPEASLDISFGVAQMEAEQQYRANFFESTPVAERDNRYLSLAWDQELGISNHLRVQASHSYFRREEPWLVRVPLIAFHPALVQLYIDNRACALGLLSGDYGSCTPAQLSGPVTTVGTDAGSLGGDAIFHSGLDAKEMRTAVDVQNTWVATSDFRAVFGLTFDQAEVDSRVYLNGRGENTVWRTFVHGEWRFAPQWLLNAGGNQEYDEDAGNYFSPRIALNWQFTDNQVLRAVYSKAVRTPDILENQADWRFSATAVNPADVTALSTIAGSNTFTFFQTGQGKGDAPTEKIVSRELGYYGRFDPVRLTVDLRVFWDRLALSEHNIEIEGSEGFLIRPTKIFGQQGTELGLDWRPWASQRFQLNYAYLNMDSRQADTSNDNLAFVPMHSGSAAWWQDYGSGWQFGTTYAFYNDLRVGQFHFDRLETRLAKKLALTSQQQLELAAVMQLRLSDEPELRKENGGDRHRGWVSLDWRY